MTDNLPMSNVRVTLDIPSQKVMAQAMEVFDEYQPIVQEALKEAKEKLLFDKDYQEKVKDSLGSCVEDVMRDGIKKICEKIIFEAYVEKSSDIERMVRGMVLDILKNMKE